MSSHREIEKSEYNHARGNINNLVKKYGGIIGENAENVVANSA